MVKCWSSLPNHLSYDSSGKAVRDSGGGSRVDGNGLDSQNRLEKEKGIMEEHSFLKPILIFSIWLEI